MKLYKLFMVSCFFLAIMRKVGLQLFIYRNQAAAFEYLAEHLIGQRLYALIQFIEQAFAFGAVGIGHQHIAYHGIHQYVFLFDGCFQNRIA